MKHLYFLILVILFAFCGNAMAQGYDDDDEYVSFGDDEKVASDYLGFCLLPGFTGLVRFYQIHQDIDGKFKYSQISQDEFMHRLAGKIRSSANPKSENWFNTYGVKDPNIVTQLWKLRYKEYPYQTLGRPEQGWSSNDSIPDLPSPAQMDILANYGIKKISDFCYGQNVLMLFRDMCNSAWVEKYKNAAYSTSGTTTGGQSGVSKDDDGQFVD